MGIPLVEPLVTDADRAAVAAYLESGGWLTEFEQTTRFEEALAEATGVDHAIVVTSGTAAIYLGLLARGIGPGDKVAVPDYTMIATANAVRWTGAEPVLVDVDETLCMDLEGMPFHDRDLRGVLWVDINGRAGDLRAARDQCEDNGVGLYEDACQALGSSAEDTPLGSIGDWGAFSFTPHKIVSTGQGGAIVTDDDAIAGKVRKLKDFHRVRPGVDQHDGLGFNFKFTDLQAALGLSQVRALEDRITRKRNLWRWYERSLSHVDGVSLPTMSMETQTPWFIEVLFEDGNTRDRVRAALGDAGIGTRPFYPPVHAQGLYPVPPETTFPVATDVAPRGLWLPSSLGLGQDEVEQICGLLADVLER